MDFIIIQLDLDTIRKARNYWHEVCDLSLVIIKMCQNQSHNVKPKKPNVFWK